MPLTGAMLAAFTMMVGPMRVALLSILIPTAVSLAGCQTPYASGNAQADALMAELQAETTATGVAATGISIAGSLDPSGMGAGAAHAINRTMLNAHTAQVNARIQNRIMGQEMAVVKCVEESKAMSGKAAEDYAEACAKRARDSLSERSVPPHPVQSARSARCRSFSGLRTI